MEGLIWWGKGGCLSVGGDPNISTLQVATVTIEEASWRITRTLWVTKMNISVTHYIEKQTMGFLASAAALSEPGAKERESLRPKWVARW